MDSYDFKGSLQTALNENPKEVILLNWPTEYYASLKFYTYLVMNPHNIPIETSDQVDPLPGTCYLFNSDYKNLLDNVSYPYDELENTYQLNPVERYYKIEKPQIVIKLRCYKK